MTVYTGTPSTLVSGDTSALVTKFNDHRDALKAVSEAWTAFTPTWTGVTTNPAIGDGTIVGAYARVNKLIHFRIVITMGATTTYGTGGWILTPPVAPVTTTTPIPFPVAYYDNGTALYAGSAFFFASSNLYLYADPTTAGNALRNAGTATIPFAWGVGDQCVVAGTYESA